VASITYRAMVFFIALNLGFYLVDESGLLPERGVAAFNETQMSNVLNASEMVYSYAESQDPTSDIAGTKYGLTFFWNAFGGMFFGFPNFLSTVPWLPGYVVFALYTLWAFLLAAWVAGFIRGRGMDE